MSTELEDAEGREARLRGLVERNLSTPLAARTLSRLWEGIRELESARSSAMRMKADRPEMLRLIAQGQVEGDLAWYDRQTEKYLDAARRWRIRIEVLTDLVRDVLAPSGADPEAQAMMAAGPMAALEYLARYTAQCEPYPGSREVLALGRLFGVDLRTKRSGQPSDELDDSERETLPADPLVYEPSAAEDRTVLACFGVVAELEAASFGAWASWLEIGGANPPYRAQVCQRIVGIYRSPDQAERAALGWYAANADPRLRILSDEVQPVIFTITASGWRAAVGALHGAPATDTTGPTDAERLSNNLNQD